MSGDEREDQTETEQEEQVQQSVIGVEGQEIPIGSLNFQQLQQLKQQLSVEIEQMQQNLKNFTGASGRFAYSTQVVDMMLDRCSKTEGKVKMLVPMSGSVYVDGYVKDSEKLLVDIGTGYYVQKSAPEAKRFVAEKQELINGQVGQIQQLLQKKECEQRMQQVYAEAMQRQEQAQGA